MRIAGAALAWVQLGALALAGPTQEPPTVRANLCSAAQLGEWRFVQEQQMSVQARARSGDGWVGLTAATDGFHDWAPFDDFKTTICGELAFFDTFEPNREGKVLRFLPEIPEHDWNIILVPTRASIFDERFKLATRLMERGHEGDLKLCFDRDHACFEAEVTPPSNLLKANAAGRWLSACRLGQKMCVFGPWVGDGGHGYRPEIHPAERIWWRDGDRMRLLFVQDASQRFGDRRQFQWKWRQPEPDAWQPWAVPGLEGEFRLAFETATGSPPVKFRIDQLLDGNMRGVQHPLQGVGLAFSLEGPSAVAMVEVALGLGSRSDRLQLDPSKLEVAPTEVCDRGDGTLQGYLAIRDKAGYRYQEGEGFDAFEVSLPLPEAPPPGEGGAEAPESLHASVRISALEEDTHDVVADLVPPSLNALRRVARARLRPAETLQGEEGRRPPIQETPATKGAALSVGFARRFRLGARPHYDGPRGERMESAINGAKLDDLWRLLAAAPAPLPERVGWTIRASNVTSPERPPPVIALSCKKRMLDNDDCVLLLPAGPEGGPPGEVLEITATASLMDAKDHPIPTSTATGPDTKIVLGAPAEQVLGLASHFIHASKSDSSERLLSWLSAADPSGAELQRWAHSTIETRPDASDLAAYRREYYARMLRHGIALATADGRITLDELSQFVDMAQAFGDLRPLDRRLLAPSAK